MTTLTPTAHIQTYRSDNVRIGPISIITLIAVICMAVLAVLAASTSNASATIANRQAEGVQMMYENERAGQEFVASLDDVLASVRLSGGSSADALFAIEAGLDGACARAREAGGPGVSCTARVEGATVTAEFICENTRRLDVAITIRDDATYRIVGWKMTSAQQTPQSAGTLWSGA